MKILNFTANEILPALLDRTKYQTIRPAFTDKKCVACHGYGTMPDPFKLKKYDKRLLLPVGLFTCKSCDGTKIQHKLPRYEVGEKVQLMWCQRSPNQEWCSNCLQGNPQTMFPNGCCMNCGAPLTYVFNKKLSIVKITEVFKIHIWKTRKMNEVSLDTSVPDGFYPLVYFLTHKNVCEYWSVKNNMHRCSDYINKLAKRDGFKSPNDMFKWFDNKYDLSERKLFWVYRWEDL